MTTESQNRHSSDEIKAERKRIRLYWIGLVIYLLAFANAIRFIGRVPYQFIVLAGTVNFVLVVGWSTLIRRAYKNLADKTATKE